MRNFVLIILTAFSATSWACNANESAESQKVKTGAEVLIDQHLHDLMGKRVGLVMNPTARVNNVHVLDTLLSLEVNVVALFAPEHGFRGKFSDGEVIENGIDTQSGLPVYSLYGSTKRPTEDMLDQVDILLFDMQDVGARFYTYNTTMKYVIEEASKFNKEVWILDRPNPAGGEYVSGWILEEEFQSMVGAYPIPVAHGLTLGELALMAVGEQWFEIDQQPSVRVIKMEGWERTMNWNDTGLEWIPPSPNLPTFKHAFVYLGTCFFEGTSLSEGRGTDNPFLTIGDPDFNPDFEQLKKLGERYHIQIDTISFTPKSIPGKALNPKHEGDRVIGVFLTPEEAFDDPVRFGIELMNSMMESTSTSSYREYIKLLAGTEQIQIQEKLDWGGSFESFKDEREMYLIY